MRRSLWRQSLTPGTGSPGPSKAARIGKMAEGSVPDREYSPPHYAAAAS